MPPPKRRVRRLLSALALLGATLALTTGTGQATFRGPNGLILFRSDRGTATGPTSHAIWSVAPNGTHARKVTRGTHSPGFETDYTPVFFPDGRRFVYVRQLVDRSLSVENQIYVKSVSAPARALGSPVLPEPVDYKILSLALAPNGRRLLLAAVPPPLGSPQIFTIGVDGSGMRQLSSGPLAALTPEFSPNGRRIVFAKRPSRGGPFAATGRRTAAQSSARGGIFTMRLDGSGQRRLTHRSGDGAPSFSPSGRRIVFNRGSKGHVRLFSIRPNGHGVTQLTHGRVVDRGPVYSPNGRKIVFTRATKGRNPDLYVMRSNGTRLHLLYAARPRRITEFGPDWGRKPR